MATGAYTVSAVLPTFNRAHCIGHAIRSVLAQTRKCEEVIVVDDGSTDNTSEVLRQFGDSIRVIAKSNSGVSAARNAGIAAASADWIAFLDSDDEWEPEKIERQIEAIARKPEFIVHATNGFVYLSETGSPVDFFASRPKSLPQSSCLDHPLEYVMNAHFMTPGIMARRDALVDIGGFDTTLTMFEDLDLFARLALRGPFGVEHTPLFRVYRRGAPGSSLSERSAAVTGHSARSFAKVCSNILNCKGLSANQRAQLQRKLSAQRADIAIHERNEGNWWNAAGTFAQSVVDRPSVTSVVRAAMGAMAGERGVALLRRLKHGDDSGRLVR